MRCVHRDVQSREILQRDTPTGRLPVEDSELGLRAPSIDQRVLAEEIAVNEAARRPIPEIADG